MEMKRVYFIDFLKKNFIQKKPRPTRSLASHLSGYKTSKKRRKTPDLDDSPDSVTSQSETSKSDSNRAVISSEPVKDDVTWPCPMVLESSDQSQ